MTRSTQLELIPPDEVSRPTHEAANTLTDVTTTFADNLSLPVHRWFRYSAGFSAIWVEAAIAEHGAKHDTRVFDPFAGSGTTLLASESSGVESWGIDAHPFISRVAEAKLEWRSDPVKYQVMIRRIVERASDIQPDGKDYPELVTRCFTPDALRILDTLRRSCHELYDDTPASRLAWLTLVTILRRVSTAGTAQWQYVLPRKQKKFAAEPLRQFQETAKVFHEDMLAGQRLRSPRAHFARADSKQCEPVPSGFASLVLTSPPYPNNYDYADATRLEMSFFQEIRGWGDLQEKVRKHLVVSCSQHVPESAAKLEAIVTLPELAPISDELTSVCNTLAAVRETKGGKKTYHLMIASYFRDLAQTWKALRRVCASPSTVCFTIGDSAPYGVYVPVVPWLTKLAETSGFRFVRFEKTRDRNIKWKNRKHRVPLQEGRLWLEG